MHSLDLTEVPDKGATSKKKKILNPWIPENIFSSRVGVQVSRLAISPLFIAFRLGQGGCPGIGQVSTFLCPGQGHLIRSADSRIGLCWGIVKPVLRCHPRPAIASFGPTFLMKVVEGPLRPLPSGLGVPAERIGHLPGGHLLRGLVLQDLKDPDLPVIEARLNPGDEGVKEIVGESIVP